MIGGLACPACGSDRHHARDTRAGRGYIRRRRVCESCGHRYTTEERVKGVAPTTTTDDFARAEKALRAINKAMSDYAAGE